MIFDQELNLLSDIEHGFTKEYSCYVYRDTMYTSFISENIIHKFSLKDNNLIKLEDIKLKDNSSVMRIRQYSDGLFILAFDNDDKKLHLFDYRFDSGNLTDLNISDAECFDLINDNELIISSASGSERSLSIYNVKNKSLSKKTNFTENISTFSYIADKKIIYAYNSSALISLNIENGTRKIVYKGAENAILSGFIFKNGDYCYLTDTANNLIIKLPGSGEYKSSYKPGDRAGRNNETTDLNKQIVEQRESGIQLKSINQDLIKDEMQKITPVSEDEFELTILTDMHPISLNIAEEIFKRKYPNARIIYETIVDSGLAGENNNPYESEYDRQLKLKLLANESDFDMFFIKSPETLTHVVHSGGYLDLSNSRVKDSASLWFDGVINSCTYENSIFGIPVMAVFYGMQVNEELVKQYKIDYPFKEKPIVYNELSAFAEKYCRDYDHDGVVDVFLTTSQEGFLPDGSQYKVNCLFLNDRYETSYINFLKKEGNYNSELLKDIDRINNMLDSFCTAMTESSKALFFGLEGSCPCKSHTG